MNIVHKMSDDSNSIVGQKNSLPALTPREREVLRWLADGKRYYDIAEITGAKRDTIASRIKSAMDKLGANTAAGAVAIALRSGIIN